MSDGRARLAAGQAYIMGACDMNRVHCQGRQKKGTAKMRSIRYSCDQVGLWRDNPASRTVAAALGYHQGPPGIALDKHLQCISTFAQLHQRIVHVLQEDVFRAVETSIGKIAQPIEHTMKGGIARPNQRGVIDTSWAEIPDRPRVKPQTPRRKSLEDDALISKPEFSHCYETVRRVIKTTGGRVRGYDGTDETQPRRRCGNSPADGIQREANPCMSVTIRIKDFSTRTSTVKAVMQEARFRSA
ncbi:hypothetical protein OE88DRAFT_1647491 [Heliocybe sulcata]|uniref:Uncharacterized protein n=1 Tax=Heliocybe sulcata TaxID=5364 RepID=A0A5C3MS27_9AGAM|nr:hypothetical protein OE88DRAFT_1647491 [Heliocybe sulcata]